MELPRRTRGDELLRPGEYSALRERLRRLARHHDLATVIAYAFEHRSRLLPFIGADMRMAPAGARAIGAAMVDSGFEKTRIVLQLWNRRFRPSAMKLDGRVPDLFLVSSMSLHAAQARKMMADAGRIGPGHRPLIVAGGPKCVYQPWDVFPEADLAVTGEEFVWLSVLEVLLTERAPNEPLRSVFLRARDRGLLDSIPGLVYPSNGELVDTGVQRLLGDLDELPHPRLGYRLLEPPGRSETLSSQALPVDRVRKHSPISSLVLTFGCKFRCPYCPIPAYNQRQHRLKSPERIADEMSTLHREYGIRMAFGTDDNFFNDHQRTIDIAETLARTEVDGRPLRKCVRWATEATVHDALQLREHMSTIRRGGLRAIWMGVEDLTATLVKKGQSVDKTIDAFQMLLNHGIHPMPMMMHHDGQPLYTRNSPYGLLNQAQILREAGAVSFQVLMMTPSTGAKLYEEAFTQGLVYRSANGRELEPHMWDGSYVVASSAAQPWRKQLNMLLAYMWFYNPLRFLKALVRPKSNLYFADLICQVIGMWGLAHTIWRTVPWAYHLWRGKIVRRTKPNISKVPIRSVDGGRASHALNAQEAADRRARPAPVAEELRPAASA
jgi:radical SAM superfamily enzyme YgiQ (UPF0313 family)